MIRLSFPQGTRPVPPVVLSACHLSSLLRGCACCAVAILLFAASATAQVIVVNSRTGTVTNDSAGQSSVDRRYQQITPTNVPLPNSQLDAKARLELIRLLQAEQGFAMRPFPRGHKGLTLVANGKLEPAGEAYLNMVTTEGLSAKPSDRVVLTDITFDHAKMVFDINGGPDKKHRFLRHIQIGAGPTMNPVVADDGMEPVGARLTLVFDGYVPGLTGAQVKALLAPLISFDLKTPVQAFTDTLPPTLKEAILNHHVLVGMSTDMLLFAMGQPDHKSRELDGQKPFEEWIYGRPPQEVDFVRINGNRVIRVEVAKMGETPIVFTKDEVAGLMRTDGTPLIPSQPSTRTVGMGDTEHNSDTQAAAAPPTLRNPGEELPTDKDTGVMKPVRFPKPKPDPQPGANPDGEPAAQPSAPAQTSGGGQPSPPDAASSAPVKPAPNSTQLL
ncbi:MAG: hypothetical protein ABSD44_02660 [Terracidiphilus sp.]